MAEHEWMPEFVGRNGDAWGHCSCGWGAKGHYQRSKSTWKAHREIHERRRARG